MTSLTKKDYQDALYVQDACNLSGIVFSFAKVMQKICDDNPGSTDARNTHPIARLYAEQIMHLSCGDKNNDEAYIDAYGKVLAAVKEKDND